MYRVFQGPTVYDRILGLNGISTKAILLLTILGSLYERLDMFVDIALGYAVLNIIGGLAVGKYLEHKETREC
jgi:multicomponent Na+:H+ antiporter subunit F